ncbi:MAG: hypothetical protein ACOX88_05130 [Christensenellales bacterium]|jgi:hypothetical protein
MENTKVKQGDRTYIVRLVAGLLLLAAAVFWVINRIGGLGLTSVAQAGKFFLVETSGIFFGEWADLLKVLSLLLLSVSCIFVVSKNKTLLNIGFALMALVGVVYFYDQLMAMLQSSASLADFFSADVVALGTLAVFLLCVVWSIVVLNVKSKAARLVFLLLNIVSILGVAALRAYTLGYFSGQWNAQVDFVMEAVTIAVPVLLLIVALSKRIKAKPAEEPVS